MQDLVCYDSDGKLLDHYTQWDTGQDIYVRGADMSSLPFFHFTNAKHQNALMVPAEIVDGSLFAEVPDVLLQDALPLIVFISYDESVQGKSTEYTVRIPVYPKAKPSGYVYDGAISNWEMLIVDDLTTNNASIALSASQGVVLKSLIDDLEGNKVDADDILEQIKKILSDAQNDGSLEAIEGKPGRGIVSISRTEGDGSPGTIDTYTVLYTDETTSTIQIYNGNDGTPGSAGGYYTPSLLQTNSNTVTFEFISSNSELPELEPIQIMLPAGSVGTPTVSWDNISDRPFGVIDGEITPIPEEYIPDCVVKSVNGLGPDENGNVEIQVTSTVEPIQVDSSLNKNSTNPVQNKVIAVAIDNIIQITGDTPVRDQIDTALSKIEHPVHSINGMTGDINLTASDVGALPADTDLQSAITVDASLSSTSTNPIQNKAVYSAVHEMLPKEGSETDSTFGVSAKNESDDGRSVLSLGSNDIAELAYLSTDGAKESYVHVGSSGVHINNLADPIEDRHPTTKKYVDKVFSSVIPGKTLAEHLLEEDVVLVEGRHYGDTLPDPGIPGRLFFLLVE